ncbi:MAG: GNAT family N-acetyltransferase [Candidatus Eremiobacteraeota bacterium]|nr:GNAT family N-acetyltransferase [Candidatus Eremiobacteraeota bacterium]
MATSVGVVESTADFERFRDLVTEYEDSLPADLRHVHFQREVGDLEKYYGPPGAAFVASLDGRAAGCVALTIVDASTAVMKKLYVKPAFRNLGLARRLLTSLTDFARGRGISRLVLDTERERLPAAYKLYVSLGFRECEPYARVDYACPTFMERKLA